MKRVFLIALALLLLCSCEQKPVQKPSTQVDETRQSKQNSPVQVDKEHQAEIEKALEQLKSKDTDDRVGGIIKLKKLKVRSYAKDIAKLLKDEEVVLVCCNTNF